MNSKSLRNFVLLAAICCFLTVVTTIGIHGLFSYGPMNFEQSIMLFQNNTYLANRWWVIFHCLFVIISMWGFLLIQFKKSPGYTGLGFLFFAVFSITEIFRQLLVLFYLNGLREKYASATNPDIQAMLQFSIENFGLFSSSLFGLFILAFGLGNLFYGMSLVREKRLSKVLGYLLILWFFGSLLAFLNDFWQIDWLSAFLETYNLIYQPVMRFLIALWLWQNFKLLSKTTEYTAFS